VPPLDWEEDLREEVVNMSSPSSNSTTVVVVAAAAAAAAPLPLVAPCAPFCALTAPTPARDTD